MLYFRNTDSNTVLRKFLRSDDDIQKRLYVGINTIMRENKSSMATHTIFFRYHSIHLNQNIRSKAKLWRFYIFVTIEHNINFSWNINAKHNLNNIYSKSVHSIVYTSAKKPNPCVPLICRLVFFYLVNWNERVFYLVLTLLHLPPLRFHFVGGCWDRTQDWWDFGIGSQTL